MTPGDVICEIGDDQDFEAVLIIDQGDVQLVREGQEVEMKLDSKRLETFDGVIDEKSNEPLGAATLGMSSQTGGDLQTEIDPTTGMIKPRSVSYQARVPLAIDGTPLRSGYRGSAKIHVEPMSSGQQALACDRKNIQFRTLEISKTVSVDGSSDDEVVRGNCRHRNVFIFQPKKIVLLC